MHTLYIGIPENCPAERGYLLDVVFGEFLGLDFEKHVRPGATATEIELGNGKKLILADAFFRGDENWLDRKNIPEAVSFARNPFATGENLIVLFGSPEVRVSENEIFCRADLLAGAFFMLTRWEEAAILERRNGRFPPEKSLAVKAGFLARPIVNEYLEFIWMALLRLGFSGERKRREFRMLPTCDVDLPRLWWHKWQIVKTLGGSLLKRRSGREAVFNLKLWFQHLRDGHDPFDTFDFLMNACERAGWPMHFFFMSGGNSPVDNHYRIDHPWILEKIREMQRRGHVVGIHPSYNSFNEGEMLAEEKSKLEQVAGQAVSCGRQHFLRFEVPTTWQIWDTAGLEWDSTLSYPELEGFRCGVCYPFPVFDISKKRTLQLIERPLIIMESSLIVYQNLSPGDVLARFKKHIETVRRYEGEFVFLWHNSSFNTVQFYPHRHIFEQILSENTCQKLL